MEQLHPTLHPADASLSYWPQWPAARELHRLCPSSLQHQKPVSDSLAVLYGAKTIEQVERMCHDTSLEEQAVKGTGDNRDE